MAGLTPRGIVRWKEWIPLVTQQLRLRSLIQISAFNIHLRDEILPNKKRKKFSYYYTLHLTAMSAPFYTSERLESENPKWSEVDIKNEDYGSANGVIIRLWAHSGEEEAEDEVVTVWGVHFSGLVYIGCRLVAWEPSLFRPNSLVLHLHGGYFTSPQSFLSPQPALLQSRSLSVQLSPLQVKPSYTLKRLLAMQSLKHAIKKESEATLSLREQILVGMFTHPSERETGGQKLTGRGSATLRKLLSKQAPPKADPHILHQVKQEIEIARFRVRLLAEQRDLVLVAVQKKLSEKNTLLEKNQDRETLLMENVYRLRREGEKKRELRAELAECKSALSQNTALLDLRRKEIISELSQIYPIAQLPDGRYTIRDVHLPNSEDFEGKDELMISVALGFAAHLVQMISFFMNVPTRYPICHFGSRSKIIDHITDNIPDKEREFPLYSRGKEKHSFNYAVYLLNKNIAQLRWYCGLSTSDLRHTLPNLLALMTLNRKDDLKRCIELKKNRKKGGALSYSLDQGLNNVALDPTEGVASDPQVYTASSSSERRRAHTDRGPPPPVHDLASLMSLSIRAQEGGGSLSDETTKRRAELSGAASDSDAETSRGRPEVSPPAATPAPLVPRLEGDANSLGASAASPSHYPSSETSNPNSRTLVNSAPPTASIPTNRPPRTDDSPPDSFHSFSSTPENHLENLQFQVSHSTTEYRPFKSTQNSSFEASLKNSVVCDKALSHLHDLGDCKTQVLEKTNLVEEKT